MANSPDDLQVIVPNLHRRYSGVTATNRMVAPRLARLYRAAWFGSDAPEGIARPKSAFGHQGAVQQYVGDYEGSKPNRFRYPRPSRRR